MERPKRAATKISDYRRYHLSGDLDTTLQGKVGEAVNNIEHNMSHDLEELKRLLAEEEEKSKRLQHEAEVMQLQHKLETERLKQEQWNTAMSQLQETKKKMEREHQENLEKMKTIAEETGADISGDALTWLHKEMEKMKKGAAGIDTEKQERIRVEQEQKDKAIAELRKQQEELDKQIQAIAEGKVKPTQPEEDELTKLLRGAIASGSEPNKTLGLLLQHLKSSLTGKKEDDPNKLLLKALIREQNKTRGEGGANTLKPNILESILGEDKGPSMAQWLANLNRQEEGEFTLLKPTSNCDGEGECKHGSRLKSGMLDKASTQIQQKQVWPQKNLGKDWADEEMEFKQLRFEHLVAGETRTIETCTDPAQILGRLKLLRRIAYLKLRGYDWHLLRKMYAAILTSIETAEYSWESNFDRFENILYRRTLLDTKNPHDKEDKRDPKIDSRKRFCRDYNRPEGCPKSSLHLVWSGSGASATKRLVYHYCAPCLIKDKIPNEHPQGHPECPHRT